MKNKFKWGGLLALAGFLGLASGTASATPIDFSFTNQGSIDNVQSCGFLCTKLDTQGDLSIGGLIVGGFEGTMKVVGIGLDQSASAWTFTDLGGTNSLSGSLGGNLLGLLQGWVVGGGGTLDYAVTGGTGLFEGATGYGSSIFGFGKDDKGVIQYLEGGSLHVDTVPEPAVNTLLLAGFGMVGFMAWRRRRAAKQI